MKAKRLILAVLAVLILAGGFYSCRQRQAGGLTLRQGVLSIGMEIGYPPMEYYDTDGVTPIGFEVEMGRAVAEKLGLRPEFIDTGWDGIFAGVETERYDTIMSAVTITPARMAAHNFSRPYIANTLAMVVLRGSNITARSPEEAVGLDVAFQAETTSDHYMMELADEGLRFTPRRYEKVMYCFDELALGRVDVIVTDLPVANDYVNVPNSPFETVWVSPEAEEFGVVLKKGNDALTDAINRALQELYADGTLQRISDKYFEADLVSQVFN